MIHFEVSNVITVFILIFSFIISWYKNRYIVIVNSYQFILLLVVLKTTNKQQNPIIEVSEFHHLFKYFHNINNFIDMIEKTNFKPLFVSHIYARVSSVISS